MPVVDDVTLAARAPQASPNEATEPAQESDEIFVIEEIDVVHADNLMTMRC